MRWCQMNMENAKLVPFRAIHLENDLQSWKSMASSSEVNMCNPHTKLFLGSDHMALSIAYM